MNIKYIFTDIDGTLYHHGNVPSSTVEALRKAKEAGHKIYICTGRPVSQIPPEVSDIIDYDGMICSSGSYIELTHQVYLDYFFPNHLQEKMVSLFNRFPITYSLETNNIVYFNEINMDLLSTFPDDFLKENPVFQTYDPTRPWPETNKICIFSKDTPEPLIEIGNLLADDTIFITSEMNTRNWWYCEISPRNISKGSAINYLVNSHRIPFTDTIAIGDSMNDYEMIKFAELGIAMGNGDERLKEIAGYVTDDIDKDGYAKALEHFKII